MKTPAIPTAIFSTVLLLPSVAPAAIVAIEGRLVGAATGGNEFGTARTNGQENIGSNSDNDGTVTLTLSDNGTNKPNWSTSHSEGAYTAGEEWNVRSNTTTSNIAGALSTGAWLAIDISSTTAVKLNSLSVDIWRNGDAAPTLYQLAYSTDATWGSSNLIASSLVSNAGNGTINAFDVTATTGLPTNITEGAFRLYYANATNTGGNFHIYNVAVDYDLVPEPSTALLGALGSLFLLRRKR